MLFEGIAVLCAGLFAGAPLYITFVEHPARLECGTELAATEFGDPDLDRGSADAAALLARWGQLHAVRSVLGTLAFVLVWHLVGERAIVPVQAT
jgi:hypothetical protein